MKRVCFGISALLVLSACALIETTRDDELTLEEAAKEECRYVSQPGSILKEKFCTNKATWAAIKERDKENAEKFKDAMNDRNAGMPKETGFGN